MIEAVALFQTESGVQAAIDQWLSHCPDRTKISSLVSKQNLGHDSRKIADLEDDSAVPHATSVWVETLEKDES